MHRHALFASLLLAVTPIAAAAQRNAPNPDSDDVRYTVSTGSISGVPLVGGRSYTIVVDGLNPLCYAYTAEVVAKEDNPDLSKVIAAFGSLPGTPTPAPAPARPDEDPKGGESTDPDFDKGAAPGRQRGPRADDSNAALQRARAEILAAIALLGPLGDAMGVVEAVVKEVNSPACARNVSYDAVSEKWNETSSQQSEVEQGSETIREARNRLAIAAASLGSVPATPDRIAISNQLEKASNDAAALATRLAKLLPDLFLARGAVNAAEAHENFSTEVFLPAGTSAVDLTVRATELRPAEGKTPATVEQKASLSVRKGMRLFLSVGYLASFGDSHDYERANRPCPASSSFTCETTYSTYVDRSPGRGYAFSPVLQVNAAFGNVWPGLSFHTSGGVAARSVNGTVSPEFILGAGAGLLDRFLVTVGGHMARDEKLLLGSPADVERAPVSDKVTPADAISVIWRAAFVTTFTIRLNN